MNTVIVYPVPLDTVEIWQAFRPAVERFCKSFVEYPPGNCIVQPVFCMKHEREPFDVFQFLDLIPSWAQMRPINYYGGGCDIGAAQLVADTLPDNPFMVCMTSRCYFHRAGAIDAMTEARKLHGPGLYGCSASHEAGRLHLCTRAYGIDAEDMRAYPHRITSRGPQRGGGIFFELGTNNPDGNLLEWMELRGRPGRLVFWDGVREKPAWFTVPNRFRIGDQSAMLIHDLHTDNWRDGTAEGKTILTQWSEGTTNDCRIS